MPTVRHVIRVCAALGAVVTLALLLYAVMPFGDDPSQQTTADSLVLAVIIGVAISPYLFMYWAAAWTMPQRSTARIRASIAVLLTLYGFATLADVILVSPDAQGALVFLFLPILQWLIIGILWSLLYLWDRLVTR